MVEADLHETYGIDCDDTELMGARSWRWLKVRIVGLCSCDSRLARALAPKTETGASSAGTRRPRRR